MTAPATGRLRAAVYARVSTIEQTAENQLAELRRFAALRGWSAHEYVDEGVSGAKDRRPALDELLRDAHRRCFDVLVRWRLDRLGRSLRHLILLLEELQALGVALYRSRKESTPQPQPAGSRCTSSALSRSLSEPESANASERA